MVDDSRRPPDDQRWAGYEPRGEVQQSTPRPLAERSARQRSTPQTRRPPRRKIALQRALIGAFAAFVVGLMFGWMARGGPAEPQLVTTNQTIPAITVTREVTP